MRESHYQMQVVGKSIKDNISLLIGVLINSVWAYAPLHHN